ncbi:MAG: hypothetical protein GY841_17755, partial [FCB group bacterium]|nr:hypothetical protein [FCB group bacterium]
NVEMFVVWADFGFAHFKSETVETKRILYEIIDGPTVYRAVDQTTSENMVTGHIGLQLASMTKRAFFRPRVALGIGFFSFDNTISWTEQDADTTVVLTSETLDKQNCFGWRALIGADFFFTPQIGATFDLVYDHVFNLKQTESPDVATRRTSRFNGITVGIIYMFKS